MRMPFFRPVVVAAGLVLALIACTGEGSTSPSQLGDAGAIGGSGRGGGSTAGNLRVRCERRASRSKVSVDGKNLAAGSYTARISSGGNSITALARATVGDEVEFDFDSARDDIAAGATAIPAGFIVTGEGPDVMGELLDDTGAVVASAGAECRVR